MYRMLFFFAKALLVELFLAVLVNVCFLWHWLCLSVKLTKKEKSEVRKAVSRVEKQQTNVGTRHNYTCRFILPVLHNLLLSCFLFFFLYLQITLGREVEKETREEGRKTCGWLASFCPLFFLCFIFPEKIKYFCLRKSF